MAYCFRVGRVLCHVQRINQNTFPVAEQGACVEEVTSHGGRRGNVSGRGEAVVRVSKHVAEEGSFPFCFCYLV